MRSAPVRSKATQGAFDTERRRREARRDETGRSLFQVIRLVLPKLQTPPPAGFCVFGRTRFGIGALRFDKLRSNLDGGACDAAPEGAQQALTCQAAVTPPCKYLLHNALWRLLYSVRGGAWFGLNAIGNSGLVPLKIGVGPMMTAKRQPGSTLERKRGEQQPCLLPSMSAITSLIAPT